jgi:hypothetical protein
MFPRGFVFGEIIRLYLVELSSLVACDSVLLVESGSNGMVSSTTTSIGGFRHPLSWETWNTLCTHNSFDSSST